jgi:hypothetical protein
MISGTRTYGRLGLELRSAYLKTYGLEKKNTIIEHHLSQDMYLQISPLNHYIKEYDCRVFSIKQTRRFH